MAAPPVQPVTGGPRRWRVGEQAPGFGDGKRDHAGVEGRGLARPGWCRGAGIGAAAQQGGSDGADGQGGHDQHGVPGDRGIEADLGLIEAETVLAEMEVLFRWSAQTGRADQPGQRQRLPFGHVTVVEGQLAGDLGGDLRSNPNQTLAQILATV